MAYTRRAVARSDAYSSVKTQLSVLIGGKLAGTIYEHGDRVRSFRYDAAYSGPNISLSMPRSRGGLFPDEVITPWIEGLLPDNVLVRQDMARKAGCGVDDLCGLLERFGLDCPGAVQIVPKGREDLLGSTEAIYRPISDAEIAERLREAQDKSHPIWVGETERWSLGGAQGKIALAQLGSGWTVCEGAAASTHIIKPGVTGFNSEALDEFASMRLARLCGLDVAGVSYTVFADVPAIVVERYDRSITDSGTIVRLHQEDLCQALGFLPVDKYSPTPFAILGVLSKDTTMGSTGRFVDALLFNYLIGATDAHAKNYSILQYADESFELAPLYDIASILPYVPRDYRMRHAAMSVGRNNIFGEMCGSNLDRFSDNCSLERTWVKEHYRKLAESIIDNLQAIKEEILEIGPYEDFGESFVRTIGANCASALANLNRNGKTADLSFIRTIHSGTVPRTIMTPDEAAQAFGLDAAKKARKKADKAEKPESPKQSV